MGKPQFKQVKKKKSTVRVEPVDSEVLPECEGYKIMRLKAFKDSPTVHFVLAKEHSVRDKCHRKPENRTIFLRSLPPFVTEESIRNAFSQFGTVVDVFFHSSPSSSLPPTNSSLFFEDVPPVKGFKVAYLVFEKEEQANRAILAPSDVPLVLFSEKPPSTLNHWIDEYNGKATLDLDALRSEVDSYMADYDQSQRSAEMSKKEEEEEDADGWVTVTKKSGIPRKESVHNKIIKRQNNKLQKTQLVNFYRFQIRESKMNHLTKLKEKFEEDKKRIAQLKESRKFKPF
ncbi:ribosomal RNA processing 7 homolog A (S. cerevisiae) [Nesidiocoris tenuis]|uniref:Ribosomal RNA processing 7 homolog A (S. cerevisiae) n=1 Tax=Nesidiocoris tenuis TaxID=355587 RepID=A0ABN7AJY5_9HEMI|nr:ribosomal RNA processing 7 homolog A (S. cerevisiae) [Nesidiocoris tenuis]